MRFNPSSLVITLALMSWAQADDFRIESRMFIGKEKEAASENVTLFRAGIVYDYLADPPKVAVFDKGHGRFILLDPARKTKTEIKTDDVLTFCESLRSLAAQGQNKFLKFAAKPEFETEYDEEGDLLTLKNPLMSYNVSTLKAQSPAAAQQYHEFSDWYTRLNAMTAPGSNPPFPRLALNLHLANRDLLPTQVRLSIPQQTPLGGRGAELRTEHKISWRLLPKDLDRIAETANQLAAFKAIGFEQYRALSLTKQ